MNKPSINLLALLVELLADQEGVKIKYEIVRAEDGKGMADRRAS